MSQERFKELKDKRVWLHGTEAEKAEYNALKDQYKTLDTASEYEDSDEVVPTPIQTAPRETITMSRQELEDLIASKVQTLQEQNASLLVKTNELRAELGVGEWKTFEETKDRKHTAWLKLYRENPMDEAGVIVGFRESKVNRDAKGYILSTMYQIDVLYKDGVKQHEIPLVQFGGITDREQVEIVEFKKEKRVKSHGKVAKAMKDKSGYTYSSGGILEGDPNAGKQTSELVDLLEIRDEITVTIKRIDGQTHKMNGKYLNS